MTISADVFNHFLGGVGLELIRVVRVDHHADLEFGHDALQHMNLNYKPSFNNTEDGFTAEASYTVKLIGARRKVLGRTTVVFRAYFNSPEPMTDGIFEIFGNGPLKLQTWPYLRELFQNLTWRSNWPPGALPIMKVGLPESPETKSEAEEG
ncbi:MAG: hypothetical protein K8R59_00495 [Thermoanaerobaculales bacterium]|nr:hypothetical protein [Thermoanaerobaculales bacterium]